MTTTAWEVDELLLRTVMGAEPDVTQADLARVLMSATGTAGSSREENAARIEQDSFRTVLGHFASGLVVVAGLEAGEPVGFTCQSFFALSLDPPLVAIAPSRSSVSWPRVAASGALSMSILASDQDGLARQLSVSGTDKFRGVEWTAGATGAPRLAGALAWLDCVVDAVHEAGDHFLVVAAVRALGHASGQPLLFYRAAYGGFQPWRTAPAPAPRYREEAI